MRHVYHVGEESRVDAFVGDRVEKVFNEIFVVDLHRAKEKLDAGPR